MPQTDWANMQKSSDKRRAMRAGEIVSKDGASFRDLMEKTRKQLNALAIEKGIPDPESLANKRAVVEAITNV